MFLFKFLLEILPDVYQHFSKIRIILSGIISCKSYVSFLFNFDRFLLEFITEIVRNFFPEFLGSDFPGHAPRVYRGIPPVIFPKTFSWDIYQVYPEIMNFSRDITQMLSWNFSRDSPRRFPRISLRYATAVFPGSLLKLLLGFLSGTSNKISGVSSRILFRFFSILPRAFS